MTAPAPGDDPAPAPGDDGPASAPAGPGGPHVETPAGLPSRSGQAPGDLGPDATARVQAPASAIATAHEERVLAVALGRLARAIARRPALVLVLSLLAALAAGWLAAARLGFQTSRMDLIGDAPFVRGFVALEAEFGDLDALVVLAEAAPPADPARARAFVDALAARLRDDPAHFASVYVRTDPTALGGRALLWLEAGALAALADLARDLTPAVVERGAAAGVLEGAAAALRARVTAGVGQGDPGEDGGRDAGGLLRGLARLLDDLALACAGATPAGTPLDAVTRGWDEAGYTTTADGRGVLLLAQAREQAGAGLDPRGAAVRALRAHVTALAGAFPDVAAGLTGKPVLQVDEMATYEQDTARSSALALLLVTGLLGLGLRRVTAPLLVGACLVLAVVLTLGGAALWPGHLNLLAVVFVVVVIGLGVDYGVHVVIRYDEERLGGHAPEVALERALAGAGTAVVAGAATTVVAFGACLFAGFQGLREFGAVAGLGVVASLAVMTTTLPAAIVLLDRARPMPPRRWRMLGPLGALDRATQRRPGLVLALALAAPLALAALAPRTGWDGNLLRLQDPGLPSVALELRLLEDERLSSAFLAWSTRDLDALRAAHARLAGLATVARAESVFTALPPAQAEKLPALARLAPSLAALAVAPPPTTRAGLDRALAALEAACEDAQEGALAAGRGDALEALEDLRARAEAARAALGRAPAPGPQAGPQAGHQADAGGRALPAAAAEYDRRLGHALAGLARRLALPTPPPSSASGAEAAGALAPLGPDDLPASARERLIGRTGAYLLRIHPRANPWDDEALAAFVDEVRGALPDVTGIPLLTREAGRLMLEGYALAGVLALAAVAGCLVLHFRRLDDALLALAALVLGGVGLAGLLGLCGARLDPANLVALPLLVGIGVDAAIHAVERARAVLGPGAPAPAEAGGPRPVLATGLGRAMVYSALTSVAGFGSLLVSRHAGTAGIGLTISLGVLSCLAVALALPPAWFAWRAARARPR